MDKRVSGRQAAPTSTSGRAPAPSGRMAPQPSGRMPVQPQTGQMAPANGSGRALQVPGPSGRMAPQPTASGRMAAQANVGTQRSSQRIAPVPASASGRQSGRSESSGRGKRKQVKLVGPELMIAGGVLGLMGLVAVGMYMMRQNEIKQRDGAVESAERIYKENIAKGRAAYEKAHNAGLLYVLGKDDKADAAKLFAPFQGDPSIYNVIFEREYKDKKSKAKQEQKAMFEDPGRMRIEKMENKGEEKDKIKVTYGFADNKTQPVVIATQNIPAAEGDAANLGGNITVIVKAQSDDIFEKALKPKAEKKKTE